MPINNALSAKDREFVLSRSRLSVLIVMPHSGSASDNRSDTSPLGIDGMKVLSMRGFAEVKSSTDDLAFGRADGSRAAAAVE